MAPGPVGADPFGCEALAGRALAAWAAAPDRLREDANAEEELARGGYRDRVLVELAQNAADAAVRGREAGRGRLLLRLLPAAPSSPPVLLAASSGAPLDAAGVRALSGLRASTKRPQPAGAPGGAHLPPEGVVGRFGVGFTAVLGVSDAPALLTAAGGVAFDRARAAALLHEAAEEAGGELAAEVGRRGASLPVLRTPFAVGPQDVPGGAEAVALLDAGWSTVVALPLREAAVDGVVRLLDAVDDPLLLALPALGEVVLERSGAPARVLRDVAERWVVVRRTGTHAPAVLAGRPAEEQADPRWSLAWALPRRLAPLDPLAAALGSAPVAAAGEGVLLAPTPTDEPLPWPAVLVAGLPLEPTRRHVEPGPAAAAVLREAGAAYADLLGLVAAERTAGDDEDEGLPDPLDLVPVGPSAGWVDTALRRVLDEVLPDVPLLVPAAGGAGRLLPGARALALEDGGTPPDADALAALAAAEPALVAAPRRHRAALEVLGVGRLALADLVDGWPLPAPGEDLGGVPSPGAAEADDVATWHDATEDDATWGDATWGDATGDDQDGAAGEPGAGLARWRALAAALAPLALDQRAREALAGLPVPLAGGRWVRGCRGALLAGPAAVDVVGGTGAADRAVAALLAEHGLRLIDPRAGADPAAAALLERLGAVPAGPAALLDDPATAGAVRAVAEALAEDDLDDLVEGLGAGSPANRAEPADPDDVVDALAAAVLGWVTADGADELPAGPAPVGVVPGARAWLLDLPLRDDGDELAPAASLVLPGSPAAAFFDPDEVAPLAADLLERWSASALVAVGVTGSAGVLLWDEVDLDDPPEELVDAAPGWLDAAEEVAQGAGGWVADEVALVRDLDLVAPEEDDDDGTGGASGVVAVLAAALEGPRAAAVLRPRLRLRGPGGETAVVASPTAVVLAEVLRPGTPDDRGAACADPDAPPALRALLPAPPPGGAALPPGWRAATGVVAGWEDLDAGAWAAVLDPPSVPGGPAGTAALLGAWRALAERVADAGAAGPVVLDVPERLACLAADGTAVRREEPRVVDDPFAAAHPACGPALLVPRGTGELVAELLDLPLAADDLPGRVESTGRAVALPDAVRALLGLAGDPAAEEVRLVLHDALVVDGERVEAWVASAVSDREPATASAVDARGAGRALAWAAGAWSARSALTDLLLAAGLPAPAGPAPAWALLVDVALDAPSPVEVEVRVTQRPGS
ncbi:hypothetical protein [uncultured Pseudokineococcus sp.]|uniref:hypothetical protein n=1 Tax=uncultured Pseudokineococcus sp. TaxID=1642928 RepID=UPI00260F5DFE|nr:hypothetical protein [uncultured Pseudokineococcus sp.]